MKKLRVVYMGTPEFAVPCLNMLIEEKYDLAAVVTQPDRPKGRGQKIAFSPVKETALGNGISILQPEKIKEPSFIEQITALKPDIIVVVAFGQFLPKILLDLPPLGCVNVHASLLPQYRGAAPIHWSVINGEAATGVTTMYMDIGMDTGDMILKESVSIGPEDTTGQIHDRLSQVGAKLLSETLMLIAAGQAPRTPQDHANASYAPLLKREHEQVNWHDSAHDIHNLIRGLNPWPGAFSSHDDKMFKIWHSRIVAHEGSVAPSGTVIAVDGFEIQVATGRGIIALSEVQPASKRKMKAGEFARGYGIRVNDTIR